MTQRVGWSKAGDNASDVPSVLNRYGHVVNSDVLGRFMEAVFRGAVKTAVTGNVAPGTAPSVTPPLSLWNPLNSGKILVPIFLDTAYISGTLGPGALQEEFYAAQGAVKPANGTPLAVLDAYLTGVSDATGQAFQGATLAAVPTVLSVLGSLVAAAGAAGPAPFTPGVIELEGRRIVPPGCVWAVEGAAGAGTTPLMKFGVSWVELDILPG